ncbi:hypothetical protein BH11GEM2_BH11GEM2_39680 [soil metagenome]
MTEHLALGSRLTHDAEADERAIAGGRGAVPRQFTHGETSQLGAILKLVIPAKAGIHLGPVNMDSGVCGNDDRISKHGFRMATR